MKKNQQDLKILYIQIRDDEPTKKEELAEFVRYSGLNEDQFTVLNVFDTPEFDESVLEGHDAVFVGGSSDASVLKPEKYPFVLNINKVLKHCVDISLPVLASCFGFQSVIVALGGEMIHDEASMEIGTYEIELNDEGKQDPLFAGISDKFWAVSGHKERAAKLPPGTINLASTKLCPFHALKVVGKPFYGFQFHPEVDREDLVNRITRYKERYLDSDGQLQTIIDESVPTPEANSLIEKFVQRIILK